MLFMAIALALLANLNLSCSKAEQEPAHHLIGIINPNKGIQDINQGFIDGLAQYGYVAGKNTTFMETVTSAEIDRALQELLKQKADLIFTVTTPATKKTIAAVKDKNIPVIFALHDPVAAGIIKSLVQQHENVTGLMLRGSVPKALDWLLELSPGIKNILVPVKFDTPAARQSLEDLKTAAKTKGVDLTVQEISNQAEIEKAFTENAQNVDAVFLLNSIFVSTHKQQIVNEAVKHRIPVGGGTSTFYRGATITYGILTPKVGRQASRLAHLILNGTDARNIPIETADFFLSVNMKTAHDAGITVSNDILMHADIIFPLTN
jgi:putative tryptophan/tyrosine transport system substrate-binding protein